MGNDENNRVRVIYLEGGDEDCGGEREKATRHYLLGGVYRDKG